MSAGQEEATAGNGALGRRLTLMFLSVCAIAVALTAATSLAAQVSDQRDAAEAKLAALAAVVAQNARAALVFDDPEAAANTLGGLAAVPGVVAGTIVTRDGSEFAHYGTASRNLPRSGILHVSQPIRLLEEELGAVHLRYDLGELRATVLRSTGIAVLVALASLGLALVVSRQLQRRISLPLSRLSSTMQTVARTKDFQVLVSHDSRDEIGELYRVFNLMLSEIKTRDTRLTDYREHLREKVRRRTRALERSNASLARARDDAEQASGAKSEFIATMSHEIRTPLNGVLGILDLLRQAPADSRQAHLLGMMRSSGDNLLLVLNDILDFSRLEAGKLTLSPEPVRLDELLEDTLRATWHLATAKGLVLELDASMHQEWLVTVDAKRLRQVLLNLLTNAVKFTASGSVVLRVHLTPQPGERARLSMAVQDSGIGIAADRIERILHPFTQADGSTSREYGGTGLGLTICRELLELMGSDLVVDSVPGEGSSFGFSLDLPAQRVDPKVDPLALAGISGHRVLQLQRRPQATEAIARQLCQWGLGCVTVHTPEQAMTLLRQPRPGFDLLLVDADSCDLQQLDTLRQATPGAEAPLPVLLLTAGELPADAPDDVLSLHQPVERAALLAALDRQLNADAEAGPGSAPPVTAAPLAGVAGLRVLLVDDGEVNRVAAGGLLEAMGCTVTTAEDGASAIALATQHAHDLVLMDISMPRMDGFEATRRIQAALDGRAPPVVALTAHADPGIRDRCRAAGMHDVVSKPLSIEALAAVVEQIAGCRTAARDGPAGPAEPAPAAPPVLDPSALATALAAMPVGNNSLVARLLEAFETEAQRRLQAIHLAAGALDPAGCQREAHGLRSAASSIGLARLAALCRTIEAQPPEDLLGAARELSDAVRQGLAATGEQWPEASDPTRAHAGSG